MKDKDVIEGNKLIAEFMGEKYYPVKAGYELRSSYTFMDKDFPTEKECFDFCQERNIDLKHPDEMWYALPRVNGHQWKYDSDWSWLMPVIEKIAAYSPDHEFDINIGKTFCSVYLRNLDDGRYLYGVYGSDDKPLPAYYQAIVQFIQWYNTQPNSNSNE